MGKAKSFRQLEQLERFHAGCSERIATCRGTPHAQREIADAQAFLDGDGHVTPEELAAYRQRVNTYARSGSAPAQPELNLEPPSCA